MANLYKLFRDLAPAPPLLVGTVQWAANGEVMVLLPDGGALKARGDAAVGARIFVRDGSVEGVAPNLSVVTIEI